MDYIKIGTNAKKITGKTVIKKKQIMQIKSTEQKNSDVYSSSSQQLNSLQSVIDSIQSPIFSLDIHYRYTCYNIRHSADMKAFYGIDISVGKNFLGCIPIKRDRELARQNLDKVISTGQTLIEPFFKIGGHSLDHCFEITQSPIMNSLGEIIGVSVVARDITETNKLQNTLAKQGEEYKTIMDAVPSIIVMTDKEGKFLKINRAAANYLGNDPKQIEGKMLHDYFPHEVADLFIEKGKKVINSGKSIIGSIGKYPLPSGRYIYTQTDVLPYMDQAGNTVGVISVITDITERQKTIEHLLNVSRLYSFLSELNNAIVKSTDQEDLFNFLCYIAVRTGGFLMAWIGLLDAESGRVKPVAHYGHEDGYLDTITSTNVAIGAPKLSLSSDLLEGKVTIIEDIRNDVRMQPWQDEALKKGYKSLASIPLKPGGKFIGNFVMYSENVEFFEYKETKLLEQIGEDISSALEKIQMEKERKQSEKDLRLLAELLNSANDGIVVFDKDLKIIYVNQTNLDMYGYSKEEFLKLPAEKMVIPEYATNEKNIKKALKQKTCLNFRSVHYRKDGSILPLEIHARKLVIEGNEYVIGIGTDITERIHAEEQLQFRSEVLNAATDTIFVWDANNNCVYVNDAACQSSGYAREELIGKNLREIISLEDYRQIMNGINKRLLVKGDAIYEIQQIRKDNAKVLGEVHSRTINIGGQTYKIAISRDITERKSYEEKLKNSYDQIEKTLHGITQSIAAIVELRDPYTAGHQMRVARLAQAIAREMNLGDERAGQIYTAGLIHDLGKLSLPAEILSKPGKLSDIEYTLIRSHPQSSHNILKNIEFAYPLARWVLEHHERMDGSGYPGRLSGEEISLESRILAVADVVEAMSSHRPYRPALGEAFALEEISRNRDKLFDGTVVDACLRLFKKKRFKFE